MQKIVVAKPYRFVPPRHGTFWPGLLLSLVPFYLRAFQGVESVTCRGVDRLRASIKAGHSILLAANHCRPCDPMVIAVLARQARGYLYIMASWHLFMHNPLYAWVLPRAGVFSVHREGTNREALRVAIELAAEARRMLLIFPEGVITRHNDRLNNLMEGIAVIARGAARQRVAQSPPGRVVVHPIAIRYFFEGNVETAVAPILESIEKRMAWRPQRELPLVGRVLKVGSAMLALKEIEYFGEPQHGEIAERVQRLVDRLLCPLEKEWLQDRHDGDVVRRVKTLRKEIVSDVAGGKLPPEEQERRERHLGDIYLAQQLAFYPAGYFTPEPTPERLLETVERFEEDTTDVARVHSPIRAVVDVGEAIDVPAEERRDGDGDSLMGELRERLTSLLAASLAQAHPNAQMR